MRDSRESVFSSTVAAGFVAGFVVGGAACASPQARQIMKHIVIADAGMLVMDSILPSRSQLEEWMPGAFVIWQERRTR
jgi:hypothetical protein